MMMTKSIWDVRFGKPGVAQDADDDDQQWITVRGARILIDGDGTVIGGAGGKFNGQSFAKAGLKAAEEKEVSKIRERNKYNDLKKQAEEETDFTRMSDSEISNKMKEFKENRKAAAKIYGDYHEREMAEGAQKVMTKFDEKYEKAEDELAARDYKRKADQEWHNPRWDTYTRQARKEAREKAYAISRERNSGYYQGKEIGDRLYREMGRDYQRWRKYGGIKDPLADSD